MSKSTRHAAKGSSANKNAVKGSVSKGGENGSTSKSGITAPVTKEEATGSVKTGAAVNKNGTSGSEKQTVGAAKTTAVQTKAVKAPAGSSGRPLSRQAVKHERRLAQQQSALQAQRRAARNRRIVLISATALVILGVGLTAYLIYAARTGTPGKNQVGASSTEQIVNSNYPPVDNIYCDQLEQTGYHVHVHLTLWIDGKQSPIPQGIGIASDNSCFYWLHAHDSTGIIHVEAPQGDNFTLGNFFDIWNSPQFQTTGFPLQLASSNGWTVYVNGQKYTGNFEKIPLSAHTLISMMYNSPNAKPDTTYNWNGL